MHSITLAVLDDIYVDGVSLTHGGLREHIWTFAAGLRESMAVNAESTCPCTGNTGTTPPPRFIGSVRLEFETTHQLPQHCIPMILCGMGMAALTLTHAAPSTALHGSTSNCHSLLLTILR